MYTRYISLTVLVLLLAGSSFNVMAQKEEAPKRDVTIHTPNGWFLHVHSDGSGYLQYGSSFSDGWPIKAGTFDPKKVLKELTNLGTEAKGGLRTHFVFHFESERKAPDDGPPARYTRDAKVIPALFEKGITASDNRNAERKALLLKTYPPGLPKP